MTRAIAPKEFPALPAKAQGWRRSNRQGSMFHAHSLGLPICGAHVNLDRNTSRAPDNLHDMQYYGVCPRCYAKREHPAVDWTKPLELIDGTHIVLEAHVPGECLGNGPDGAPDEDGDYWIVREDGVRWPEGPHRCVCDDDPSVRNRA